MTSSRAYGLAQRFQKRRSARSRKLDSPMTAKITFPRKLGMKDYSKWKRHPDRYDIEGIDTPDTYVGINDGFPTYELDESQWRILDPDGYEKNIRSRFLSDYRTTGDPETTRCPRCGALRWRPIRSGFEEDVYRTSFLCLRCRESVVFDTAIGPVSEMGEWAVGQLVGSRGRYILKVFRAVKGSGQPEVFTVHVSSDGSSDLDIVGAECGFPYKVKSKVRSVISEALPSEDGRRHNDRSKGAKR